MLLTALRVGADALRINPLRTVLSTLGMIIGVGALVAVLSLGDGMERTARAQVQATSPIQALSVSSRVTESVDGDQFALPDTLPLGPADLAVIQGLPGIARASLVVQAREEMRRDTVRRLAMVRGTLGTSGPAPELAAGRALAPADSLSRVVVLNHLLARRLAAPAAPASLVGEAVTIAGDTLRVVGVLADAPGPPVGTADAPYRLAEALAARRGTPLPSIAAEAARIEDVAPAQQAIERHLTSRLRVGQAAGWRSRFSVETYRARAEQAAQGILIFKLLMGAITGISLLVGGIGIMNVLLASVSERTREIGIRRAAGATRRDILLQFLAESVAISTFGSLAGIVLGLVGSFGITAAIRRFAQAAFIQASFSVSSLVAAAGASLLIGLAFGTYPARRAAQLDPIDAIRHE